MTTSFLFISGGVASSLGKGLTAASIAMLLESRGLTVSLVKLDPYLNIDPGTMSPFQHGEVYVTDDGAETDLDLGHYFRFSQAQLSRHSNATAGQIYESVIKNERRGDYLGHTVQVIPHVTDEIKRRIYAASTVQGQPVDLVLVEVGGTVGDIESLPFLEALRQMQYELPDRCMIIHLTYVPYLKAAGELKTKPTQHSVQHLRQIGLIPNIILCRCEEPISAEIRGKISLFCSVPKENVFSVADVGRSIYEVPLNLHAQGLDDKICSLFRLETAAPQLDSWQSMVNRLLASKRPLTIGVVGKYLQHQDAYKSVWEALAHAAIFHEVNLEIVRFDAEKPLDLNLASRCDGFLIPGGFGGRGWDGVLSIATYCREKKIPYFGICLGMQVLLVEFARHCLGLSEADSVEMNTETPDPVVAYLDDQKELSRLGGTMRLGSFPCSLKEGSLAHQAYQSSPIAERHRHRLEFNSEYASQFEQAGCTLSGTLTNGRLIEIAELKDHPWMLGVQFHPEFKSKPTAPHPLFIAFLKAAMNYSDQRINAS